MIFPGPITVLALDLVFLQFNRNSKQTIRRILLQPIRGGHRHQPRVNRHLHIPHPNQIMDFYFATYVFAYGILSNFAAYDIWDFEACL